MLGAAALSLSACSGGGGETVTLTGASTIGPIAEVTARDSNVDAEIESVGSNEGFARFCAGEADINNASVPIAGSDGEEDFQALCEENGVEYVEPAATDSVSGDHPLARDLYIYVSVDALENNEAVGEYAEYLLENGRSILPRTFFFPLDESEYEAQLEKLADRETGAAA